MTYNPISQNNDDDFHTALCAYLRGEANGIVPGTVGEEQAEIAKRLFQDNPAILNDKDRLLLSEIVTIHYRERGIEAAEDCLAKMHKKDDDDLFAHLVAYVRDQPHEIEPGTNGEAWAEHAKQLATEDPAILDDQKRLLTAVRGWSRPEEAEPLEPGERWLVHNGRINRDCISEAEYNRRIEERRAAGLLIDPSTAEFDWNYAKTLDPYGDRLPLLPELEQVGREYFARAPDSDIWVNFGDLPDVTRDAIWKRFDNTKSAILRIRIDRDRQLRMTGFPLEANHEGRLNMNDSLFRGAITAAEQAIEMARKLEHLTPEKMGWPGLSPAELVASEFRCWLMEEMNEARK
jgi:hypothetical protein